MPAITLKPIAMPRREASKASVRMAAELAMINEPPMPCTTRSTMMKIAPAVPAAGVTVRAMEASAKTTNPALYILTRPTMSPIRPTVTTSTAVTSR